MVPPPCPWLLWFAIPALYSWSCPKDLGLSLDPVLPLQLSQNPQTGMLPNTVYNAPTFPEHRRCWAVALSVPRQEGLVAAPGLLSQAGLCTACRKVFLILFCSWLWTLALISALQLLPCPWQTSLSQNQPTMTPQSSICLPYPHCLSCADSEREPSSLSLSSSLASTTYELCNLEQIT